MDPDATPDEIKAQLLQDLLSMEFVVVDDPAPAPQPVPQIGVAKRDDKTKPGCG